MKLNKSLGTVFAGLSLAFGLCGSAFAGGTSIVSGPGGSTVTAGTLASSTTVSFAAPPANPTLLSSWASGPGSFSPTGTPPTGEYGAGTSETGNAYVAKPYSNGSAPSQNWAVLGSGSTQANWLSPYVNTSGGFASAGQGADSQNPATPKGYYEYTTTYTLAPGQTTFYLKGNLLSDGNVYQVLLDGTQIGYTPGSGSPYSTPGTFSGAGSTSNGTATLTIIVEDGGTTTGGFDTRTGVTWNGTFVPEPATIVAFLIAMLGIAVLMLKNRKGQFAPTLA